MNQRCITHCTNDKEPSSINRYFTADIWHSLNNKLGLVVILRSRINNKNY